MLPSNHADVIVAGHICLDIIPALDTRHADMSSLLVPGKLSVVGPAAVSTGGAVSNTGLALHRLGVKTRLVGKVGNDPFGQAVLSILRAAGASLADDIVISDDEATSYAVVINPPGVDRMFLHCPGANDSFSAADVDFSRVAGARMFHFGYPPLMRCMRADDGSELEALLRAARQRGLTVTLDMAGIDPDSDAARTDWERLLKRVLPYVDIFLPSIEETLFMLDREQYYRTTNSPEADAIDGGLLARVADRLLAAGAAVIVLKLGDHGMYLRTSADIARLAAMGACAPAGQRIQTWCGRELLAPCLAVEVQGTTGAGDCAIAGFLAGFLREQSPEDALTSAVAVGACNVERPDATSGIPDWTAVQRRLRMHWARRPVTLPLPGWSEIPGANLWTGPHDELLSA